MKKVEKGKYGYFSYEKKKRLIITLILFAIPLSMFFACWIYYGTKNTIWTVITCVGTLPACKSLVGFILISNKKSLPTDDYRKIKENTGNLLVLYELYITFYEKSALIDSAVICGNSLVCLCKDKKVDLKFIEKEISNTLDKNGYKVNVNIVNTLKVYTERLKSLNIHYKNNDDIPYKKSDRYPNLNRNELVAHTLMAMAL